MNEIDELPILFGGDYNPEQWPENTWQSDIDKLKQANINSATINVFSWSLLEPTEGKYNFTKLDKIFELLEKNSMNVIMATSTGAIPAWMSIKYSEVNRINVDGVRQNQGKRHNACPNSEIFRKLTQRLVRQIAKRYSFKSNLIAWHVSNEYEGYCYCEQCKKKFRLWLKKKYKSLSILNQNWNSNFWSHTINAWDEVVPPMMTTDLFPNGKSVLSGAEIDYRRFQTESLLESFVLERDVIKSVDQKHPVTTNFMGSKKDLDYFKWASEIDMISWDNYPMSDDGASKTAMNHDLMRGLRQQPFMLMEQTPNQQNWYPFNKLKRPNEMRMLSYQALAHGANGINFFQLKQSRSGAEKFHGAVLNVGDAVNSRTYQEIKKLGNELAKLPIDLKKSEFQADVAIIFDWESYWGIENSIGPLEKLSYVDEVQKFYKALYDSGINVDVISKTANLNKYSLVLAPVLYMWNSKFVTNVTKYVKSGGTFLTSYLAGIADEMDQIFVDGYLAPLHKVLGIKVDERDARSQYEPVDIMNCKNEKISTATGVCDLVIPQGARSIAHYGQEVFYSRNSAITVNNFGEGQAFYCGASLDAEGMKRLVELVSENTNLKVNYHPDVEVTTRVFGKSKYVFVINTSEKKQNISSLELEGTDLLSGRKVREKTYLESFEIVILETVKN